MRQRGVAAGEVPRRVVRMTHTTKTSKPPTDTGMTARKRWNELDRPAMQALAVLMSDDNASNFFWND